MSTAILQREIRELKQRQARLEQKIAALFEGGDLLYGDWELKPSAVRRIERARRHIAAGKGVTCGSAEDIRRYFRKQRHGR